MGFDEGFDIYPALSTKDQDAWVAFLKDVVARYKSDPAVVQTVDRIKFNVSERPSLYFAAEQNLCFSSKVSGRLLKALPYIAEVHSIAEHHFPNNIHPWSELYENYSRYSWTDVYNARRAPEGANFFLLDHPRPSFVTFSEASLKVLEAFGKIHVGMNGLMFESASFPVNHGFRIVKKNKPGGCSVLDVFLNVSSIEDWTANEEQASDPIAKKAYWAARCSNNCETLNRVLQKWLVRSSKDYVIVNSNEAIKISSLSIRTIGLTPHHVGTVVEPPMVSKIPPSPDGETYHVFLVGELYGKPPKVYALDCSCAQYGVFGGGRADGDEPYIACEIQHYLALIASCQGQSNHQASSIHMLLRAKLKLVWLSLKTWTLTSAFLWLRFGSPAA